MQYDNDFFLCFLLLLFLCVSDEVRRLGLSESRLWSVSKILQERT